MRVTFAIITSVCAVWITALYCRPDSTIKNKKVKRILSWVPLFGDPYFNFGDGSRNPFKTAGCAVTACEFEGNRRREPLKSYDALIFHGFEYYEQFFGVPNERYSNQIYVFMTLESTRRSAIPQRRTNFYNYTMTYRLDSDVPWPYFVVVDKVTGEVVAPSANPKWIETDLTHDQDTFKDVAKLITEKKKLVAWFVSNCYSYSGREKFASDLNRAGVTVDIYGRCGTLSCPISDETGCKNLLRKYYFYLASENSLCEDYVTEKVTTAFLGGAVPIVLNGANMTRFLPPKSYIDGREKDVETLAEELIALTRNEDEYSKYFTWRSRYRLEGRGTWHKWPRGEHPFCKLCEVLHKDGFKNGKEVRGWWHRSPTGTGLACDEPD